MFPPPQFLSILWFNSQLQLPSRHFLPLWYKCSTNSICSTNSFIPSLKIYFSKLGMVLHRHPSSSESLRHKNNVSPGVSSPLGKNSCSLSHLVITCVLVTWPLSWGHALCSGFCPIYLYVFRDWTQATRHAWKVWMGPCVAVVGQPHSFSSTLVCDRVFVVRSCIYQASWPSS